MPIYVYANKRKANIPLPRMMHCKRSSSIRSSAADIIAGNDDLLMEILLLLPSKPLIRFKLVSKHWCSLISSRSFSHLHTFRHHGRPQHSFLLRAYTSQFFVCDPTIRKLIPFHFRFPFAKILQSCNGLLLLECRNTTDGRNDYYILNPTTMQSRNLLLTCMNYFELCLIFNPSESPHYKVICFFPPFSYSTRFIVYHSEKHEWKDEGKSFLVTYKFWEGVHFKDGIYFVRSGSSALLYRIPNPNPKRLRSPGAKKNYTVELNGILHHLRLCLRPDKNRLHVYERKEIEHGWSKKYRAIDFDAISATFSGDNGTAIDLLGMIRGEMMNDSILLFHVPGKIMIYRFSDEVFEVLVDFRRENYFQEDRLQFEFDGAHRFIYSLAPV